MDIFSPLVIAITLTEAITGRGWSFLCAWTYWSQQRGLHNLRKCWNTEKWMVFVEEIVCFIHWDQCTHRMLNTFSSWQKSILTLIATCFRIWQEWMKFLLEVITLATNADKTKGERGNRVLPSLKINYTPGGFNTVINPSGRESRLLPLKMFASFIKKDYETAAAAATGADPEKAADFCWYLS